MDENTYYTIKLAPEIVEMSKVYKNENFELLKFNYLHLRPFVV